MNLPAASTSANANNAFAALTTHQYLLLTTYRKSGAGVPTPVWFAQDADRVYVMTPASTGKLKRIHNNGRATLAPCKANGQMLGASIEGTARILSLAEQSIADRALVRKYGLLYRIFIGLQIVRHIKRTYIEIQPVQA
jgi:PPOX class probable F420-dependent enzyme